MDDAARKRSQRAEPSTQMLDQPQPITVRPSTEDDVASMLAIYAYHVRYGLGDYHPMPI